MPDKFKIKAEFSNETYEEEFDGAMIVGLNKIEGGIKAYFFGNIPEEVAIEALKESNNRIPKNN